LFDYSYSLLLGETPVVVYVGGIPSNRDKSYLFLKNGKGSGIMNDIVMDPNFEEGFPKYNPQTFDWEYDFNFDNFSYEQVTSFHIMTLSFLYYKLSIGSMISISIIFHDIARSFLYILT
jgi:hypothetical protein